MTYNVGSILTNSNMIQSIDGKVHEIVVYSDPNITWFSKPHYWYILIAVVPYISLVVIPALLLCVYPTRIYRHLSRFPSARKRLAITAFAEALHNCFKDGLNGTWDYRPFIGIMLSAMVEISFNCIPSMFNVLPEVIIGSCIFLLSLLFSYLRPCKLTIANLSLSYHLMVAGLLSIALHLWQRDMSTGTAPLEGVIVLLPIVSHVLILIWASYEFFKFVFVLLISIIMYLKYIHDAPLCQR